MTQNEAEIAYVAGLLEGEGCFGLNGPGQKHIKIRMETTDYDVAIRLQSYIGNGTVRQVTKRQAHWKQAWVYSLYRGNAVREVLVAIRPWMGRRRIARFDELLSICGC